MHKNRSFKSCKTNGKGHFLSAIYQRYEFKIYDKGTQARNQKHKVDSEILRFEVKYSNMEDIRKEYGILTLDDFLTVGLEKFVTKLIEKWQEVIFYEKEIFEKTKHKNEYNNVKYWEELKPENFKYHKREMNKKIKKHEKSTKEYIIKAIQEKSNELLQTLPKLNIHV